MRQMESPQKYESTHGAVILPRNGIPAPGHKRVLSRNVGLSRFRPRSHLKANFGPFRRGSSGLVSGLGVARASQCWQAARRHERPKSRDPAAWAGWRALLGQSAKLTGLGWQFHPRRSASECGSCRPAAVSFAAVGGAAAVGLAAIARAPRRGLGCSRAAGAAASNSS